MTNSLSDLSALCIVLNLSYFSNIRHEKVMLCVFSLLPTLQQKKEKQFVFLAVLVSSISVKSLQLI